MADQVSISVNGATEVSGVASPPDGATIELVAKIKPEDPSATYAWTRDGTAIPGGVDGTLPIPSVGDGDRAVYEVTASSSNNVIDKATIEVAEPDPAAPTPTPTPTPPGSIEIEPGEWDAAFAWVTGVVVAVAAAVALYALTRNIQFKLPPTPSKSAAAPTYSEALRAIVVIGVLCLGIVSVALGVWMAGLEGRGRLRRTVTVTSVPIPVDEGKRGALPDPAAVLDGASKIIDSASRLRGTIAVLVVGVVLILGTLWSVGQPTTTPPATSQPSTTSPTSAQPAGGAPREPGSDSTPDSDAGTPPKTGASAGQPGS